MRSVEKAMAAPLPLDLMAEIVQRTGEPKQFCASRGLYDQGKLRLLPRPGMWQPAPLGDLTPLSQPGTSQHAPPEDRTPLQQTMDAFVARPRAARRRTLRLVVARLAPPSAREAVWLGNMLPAPTPALGRQQAFALSLSPAAQRDLAFDAARNFARFQRLEGDQEAPARQLCERLPGADEPDPAGRLAHLFGGLLTGTGQQFFWADRTAAYLTLQQWLVRPRGHGWAQSSWRDVDTAHLHDLLCMLGHDPLAAWEEAEVKLLKRQTAVELWTHTRKARHKAQQQDLIADLRDQQVRLLFGCCAQVEPEFPHWVGFSARNLQLLSPLLCSLTPLRQLNLINMQLQFLPQSLSTLTRLTGISLEGNALSAMPPVVAHWPQLAVLQLVGNRICPNSPLPGGLTALTRLGLKANGMNAFPMATLGLASLRELDVSYNPIGSLPGALQEQTALQIIAYGLGLNEAFAYKQVAHQRAVEG